MKKSLFIVVAVFLMAGTSFAQKFAFVDTEYILNRIPTYKAAQEQIDKISADYQKEIEGKYQEVDKVYKDFQKEKVLLTEDQKSKKEEELNCYTTANASATTLTFTPSILRSSFAHDSIVDPVVITSSTSKICFPIIDLESITWKMPSTFVHLSYRDRLVWVAETSILASDFISTGKRVTSAIPIEIVSLWLKPRILSFMG